MFYKIDYHAQVPNIISKHILIKNIKQRTDWEIIDKAQSFKCENEIFSPFGNGRSIITKYSYHERSVYSYEFEQSLSD